MTGARMAPRFRAMPERRRLSEKGTGLLERLEDKHCAHGLRSPVPFSDSLIPPISKRLSEKRTGLLEAP